MTVSNIIRAVNGSYFGPDDILDKEITGADLDSRKIEAGYLFIATKGERVDGHSFIESVLEKGALCVIGEDEPKNKDWPYIKVESSFTALKSVAEFYREQLNIIVVGITGSVGKTGTKEAVATVLAQRYNVLKTAGNFNNEVGLPLTVLRIRDEHEVAVLEMGISDFGEMHRLTKIAKPDICLITNIGLCHLENLKTQDGIYKAKSEIFDYIKDNGIIILNGDDAILSKKKEIKGIKPCFFGNSKELDVYAENIDNKGLLGSEFDVVFKDLRFRAKTNLPGIHSVTNSLSAAMVAKVLGLDETEIIEGIENVKPVGGRSNLIKTDKYLLIDDCYNANPVSMKEALDLLDTAVGRKVAILGDMFELGDDSDKLHFSVGEYAANKDIDVILLAGENSKNILDALKNSGDKEVIYYDNTDSLIEGVNNAIKMGDSILIKASHGMHFEKVVEKLKTI